MFAGCRMAATAVILLSLALRFQGNCKPERRFASWYVLTPDDIPPEHRNNTFVEKMRDELSTIVARGRRCWVKETNA